MEVKAGATFETSPPRQTLHLYAATSDGQRFLVMEPPGVSNNAVEPMYVIGNWPALLVK